MDRTGTAHCPNVLCTPRTENIRATPVVNVLFGNEAPYLLWLDFGSLAIVRAVCVQMRTNATADAPWKEHVGKVWKATPTATWTLEVSQFVAFCRLRCMRRWLMSLDNEAGAMMCHFDHLAAMFHADVRQIAALWRSGVLDWRSREWPSEAAFFHRREELWNALQMIKSSHKVLFVAGAKRLAQGHMMITFERTFTVRRSLRVPS